MLQYMIACDFNIMIIIFQTGTFFFKNKWYQFAKKQHYNIVDFIQKRQDLNSLIFNSLL